MAAEIKQGRRSTIRFHLDIFAPWIALEKVKIHMVGKLGQADRIAEFSTPLGKDLLVLTNFSGSEGLGQLFEYHVEALSEQENIDFDKAIGQNCQVKLKAYDGKVRIYNGVMTEARWVGTKETFYHYNIVLRPWFWLLGHKAGCRVFRDKNVKDIIKDVFDKAGFNDYEFRTTSDYDKIEYCVQYCETDFAFCSRLMETYGIYYFFEPSDGKHTLVLADSRSSHKSISDLPKVPFKPLAGRDRHLHGEPHLTHWVSERRFRTGKVHYNDYDFKQPKKNLKAPKEASEKYTHSKLEVYDYDPCRYDDKSQGEKHAQFHLEAEQSLDHRRHSSGDAASLHPGGLVTLDGHETSSENTEYLVVGATHMYSSEHYRSGHQHGAHAGADDQVYNGSYEFQPSDRPYRSQATTPEPRIYGVQIATVVAGPGESGEEISSDEFGRIAIHFPWDILDDGFRWARVAQVWAGPQWGGIFTPRVGMEVVVEFEEGDPDHPLVVGCVYNGQNKPPYDLPANKTQSGVKSNSSKGGGGYNEFRFEDKKGSEDIVMHAEKDCHVTIQHVETRNIGKNFAGMGDARVTGIQNGDDTLNIYVGNQNTTVGMKIMTQAMVMITLQVGESFVQITPASITLNSPTVNILAQTLLNIVSGNTTMAGGPVLIAPGPLTATGVVAPPA